MSMPASIKALQGKTPLLDVLRDAKRHAVEE
jgi:hypothetical protein